MSVYDKWKQIYVNDPQVVLDSFNQNKPNSLGFDTETTGLHIIKDKPFLFQLGWNTTKESGIVYLFEPTPNMITLFFDLCKRVNYAFAHNLKYDLHMLTNIGYGKQIKEITVWCDTQAIARLALEALSAREGGDNLKLKDLGVKYVHPDAANSEKLIKAELKKLNDSRRQVLASALKQFDHPTETKIAYFRKDTKKGTTRSWYELHQDEAYVAIVSKKWTLKHIEDLLKDPTLELSDLPQDVREVWTDWLEEYPEPTYADIDPAIMRQYAGEDIVTMMMLVQHFMPIVRAREQMPILQLENDCLLPTYEMERVGLKTDKDYLEQARIQTKNYIIKLRKELYELAGEIVNCGQHARLKALFDERWDITLDGCDAQELKNVERNFTGEPKRFAILISNLRTLEKWYSTYIIGVQKNASYDGRAYTQINLNGAVSGRMSSNFQQFPRGAVKTIEGEELYYPRKAFLTDGEMVFIDYDQIELVTQAHYTLLVSGGDTNLCRAYMPFKCTHYVTGEVYDYKSAEGRARHDELDEEGNSAWRTEDGQPWTKSDLHTITASKAFPDVPTDSIEFKKDCRPKGKTTNFSCNYGGKEGALVGSLGVSFEEATKLVNGYNEAYPHVIKYQGAISTAHARKGYVVNHFGRRYYLRDSRNAYKLANYVIQGTCADALKKALVKLYRYLDGKQSKLVLPVHDELMFWIHPSERGIEQHLLEIMQSAFDWCLVPVSAGIERSSTTWEAKAA